VQKICELDDNIEVEFVNNREEVIELLSKNVEIFGSDALYYISGIPSMVDSIQTMLKERNIPENRIIVDSFIGYD
jgi:Na+-transporting NADH:ubiquinone oxidoreductase subunit NqrF